MIGHVRLYHFEPWEVSARELDILTVLADTIALALVYTRLLRVVNEMKGILDDVHPIWLEDPSKG